MSEEKPTDHPPEQGHVVYSRPHHADGGAPAEKNLTALLERGRVAPALPLLLVSFVLLVSLVYALGYLSVKQVQDESARIQQLGQQQTDRSELLLNLKTALNQLNNEARTRLEEEARGGIRNPFARRLQNARENVKALQSRFEHLPIAQTEKGLAFRNELDRFIQITNDPNDYSLEGFKSFRTLDALMDGFLADANLDQKNLQNERLALDVESARKINTLNFIAVLLGALIAAATTWEVQRRYRQMRRSLEEARRERQFSSQMLQGMVSAVAAIDGRGHIRSANEPFSELFPQAHVGASIYEEIAAPEALKMFAAATSSNVEHATYRGRWLLSNNGNVGPRRSFDVYSSPLELDGERGQILTLVDVTEAAEAEAGLRKQESLAAVGQAVAQVAHEIKNPLGSIRLGVAMLRDMTKVGEAHTTIDLVERGIEHLSKLTIDVTQFSRDKQLTLEKIDVNHLVEDSLEFVADRIQEKRAPIEKHLSAESLKGELDADQLRQVFLNLLANALDASEPGSPISIKTERVAGAKSNGDQAARVASSIPVP